MLSFEDWFGMFIKEVNRLGYVGVMIDADDFIHDYNANRCAFEVAQEWVKVMTA